MVDGIEEAAEVAAKPRVSFVQGAKNTLGKVGTGAVILTSLGGPMVNTAQAGLFDGVGDALKAGVEGVAAQAPGQVWGIIHDRERHRRVELPNTVDYNNENIRVYKETSEIDIGNRGAMMQQDLHFMNESGEIFNRQQLQAMDGQAAIQHKWQVIDAQTMNHIRAADAQLAATMDAGEIPVYRGSPLEIPGTLSGRGIPGGPQGNNGGNFQGGAQQGGQPSNYQSGNGGTVPANVVVKADGSRWAVPTDDPNWKATVAAERVKVAITTGEMVTSTGQKYSLSEDPVQAEKQMRTAFGDAAFEKGVNAARVDAGMEPIQFKPQKSNSLLNPPSAEQPSNKGGAAAGRPRAALDAASEASEMVASHTVVKEMPGGQQFVQFTGDAKEMSAMAKALQQAEGATTTIAHAAGEGLEKAAQAGEKSFVKMIEQGAKNAVRSIV